jgi:SAM-dependent methyltransferase
MGDATDRQTVQNELSECVVCRQRKFMERYPNNFSGTPESASAYFLTDRIEAVHGRIVECDSCGFVFTSPQFAPETYEQIYGSVPVVEKPPGRKRAVAERYRRLSGFTRKFVRSGRFFDFGCGDGQFLDHMPGFEGLGLELRSGSVEVKDGRVIMGNLASAIQEGALARGSFDFVTTWDVLEHLPLIASDVAMLRSLLKPGGWFFCTVPNVASLAARLSGSRWNCYLLEHLWYFSPATLTRFMESHGFVRREVRGFPFPVDVATLASRIGQIYGMTPPIPKSVGGWTLALPIGEMFAAFQLATSSDGKA